MTINCTGVLAATLANRMFGALFFGVLGRQLMIALGGVSRQISQRLDGIG